MKNKKHISLLAWILAICIIVEPLGITMIVKASGIQEESQENQEVETNLEETTDSTDGTLIDDDNFEDQSQISQDDTDSDLGEVLDEKADDGESTNQKINGQEEGNTEEILDVSGDLKEEKSTKVEKSPGEMEESVLEALNQKAKDDLANIINQKEIQATVYNCDTYEINEKPDCFSNVVSTVATGQQIFIEDVEIVDGAIWYQIRFAQNDQIFQGYILDDYAICIDQEFTTWRENLIKSIMELYSDELNENGYSLFSTSKFEQSLDNFPSSYRPYLRKLHSAHPKWTFVAQKTGLDWSTVISNEMYPTRNLVEGSNIAPWKSMAKGDYNAKTGKWIIKSDPNWVQASTSIVKYYMDPRNFLNEVGIYQFELQTYNSNSHTQAGVESILKGTFMEGTNVKSKMTYAAAFMKIGKELNVSPYLLASRVRQEQGSEGKSALISGNVSGYEGYYNYFNIEASGETRDQIIENGMREAKREGWNSRYRALLGGSKKIAQNYISQGQDTFYLQKFDVDSSYNGCYWHQYMQNLQAAESESRNVKAAYTAMGVIDNTYVFKIPVYNNMTASACSKPTKTTPGKGTINSVTSAGYNKVKIKWKKVSGASGYYIYRSTSQNGTYTHVKTVKNGSTTSGINAGLKTGKTYYYKIRAYVVVDSVKLFGKYSGVKSAKPRPSKTKITKMVSTDYRSIKLSWNKVEGASGYEIYRSTKKTGTYKQIKRISPGSKTTYTNKKLTTGKTYYYKIRAYRNVGSKTHYSSYSGIVSKKVVPKTPKITSIKATSTTKINLKWDKVSGVNGYKIYRGTSKNGTYEIVRTITKGTTTSYTDRGLTSGKRYYYRIKAFCNVKGKEIMSSYSSKKGGVTQN